jgi:hypothetical protein
VFFCVDFFTPLFGVLDSIFPLRDAFPLGTDGADLDCSFALPSPFFFFGLLLLLLRVRKEGIVHWLRNVA